MSIRHTLILTAAITLLVSSVALAEITISGDITPDTDPTTWVYGWSPGTDVYIGKDANGNIEVNNESQVGGKDVYIGYKLGSTGTVTVDGSGSMFSAYRDFIVGSSGNGEVNITGGGELDSSNGYIGKEAGSSGVVTVDGVGSKWTSSFVIIGRLGGGVLNISQGAQVESDVGTFVGYFPFLHWYNPDVSGKINFDNGTLTTGSFLGSIDDITGTGTINAKGILSDVDLIFDSTHGTSQSFIFTQPGVRNLTFNLDVDGSAFFGAGHSGYGSTSIADGVSIDSDYGYIGYKPGSTGVVSVDGTDSTWNNDHSIFIGHLGTGELNITNGAQVNTGYGTENNYSYIGHKEGSSGVVNVDGIGSEWNNDCSLSVGYFGRGELNITGGGKVFNRSRGFIGTNSKTTVDGEGSTWINGTNGSQDVRVCGELNITAGGLVESSSGHIEADDDSIAIVNVEGAGSQWDISGRLKLGYRKDGELNITDGGLVNSLSLMIYGGSSINMSTGGMLALRGEADESLAEFFDLIYFADAINYWDASTLDWANITDATMGIDYTLNYLTEGDLTGYTVLTVPEPATISLLLLGGLAILRRKNRA